MRIQNFAPCLLLAATTALAGDFIRQIQVVNGVTVTSDIPVQSAAGEVVSGALMSNLSIFQLYASHTKRDESVEILKLDEKVAGTFLPEVNIETFSEDPHVPTRTRADQPYGVTVTVQGLASDLLAPEYAKFVVVGRGYRLYSPETYQPVAEQLEYEDSASLLGNGTFTETEVFQQLPVGSPTKAVGSETFTAFMHPDAGVELAELKSADVMVWPVASASVRGIEPNETYFGWPKDVVLDYTDAYPRSVTFAQVYKGPAQLGSTGVVLSDSIRSYGEESGSPEVPQNVTVELSQHPEAVLEDGEYTLEILTITPFNREAAERLAYVTFVVNRTLEINGGIYDAESVAE